MTTWTRKELKKQARNGLKHNYCKITLIAMLVTIMSGSFLRGTGLTVLEQIREISKTTEAAASFYTKTFDITYETLMLTGAIAVAILIFVTLLLTLLRIFLFHPLLVGCCRFFRRSLAGQADIKDICFGFDHSYKNNVKTLFFQILFIRLWSLVFIIPGIIKFYEYAMIPYILSDDPTMETKQAFALSKQMTKGHKWNMFLLGFSFLPWDIIGVMTLGLTNVFYLSPYKKMTFAALYEKLKKQV